MSVVNGLSTDDRKSIFLMVLKEMDGNITRACEAAGISRQSYYNWFNDDDEFQTSVKMVQLNVTDEMLDEAESVVKFAVKRGDREVAKWVLSRLGKHRGYGAKVEIQATGEAFRGLEFPDEPLSMDEWAKRQEKGEVE